MDRLRGNNAGVDVLKRADRHSCDFPPEYSATESWSLFLMGRRVKSNRIRLEFALHKAEFFRDRGPVHGERDPPAHVRNLERTAPWTTMSTRRKSFRQVVPSDSNADYI